MRDQENMLAGEAAEHVLQQGKSGQCSRALSKNSVREISKVKHSH